MSDFIQRILGSEQLAKSATEVRMVSTDRPVEFMLITTGKSPEELQGKKILNVGSGKTHYGLELTKRYGVVPKKVDNLDLKHALQPPLRRVAGLLLGETVGDIETLLPYPDDTFDLVYAGVAPINIPEFVRVTKPGGEVFVWPGHTLTTSLEIKHIKETVPNSDVRIKTIAIEDLDPYAQKVTRPQDRHDIMRLVGDMVLVLKKRNAAV